MVTTKNKTLKKILDMFGRGVDLTWKLQVPESQVLQFLGMP